MLLTVTVFETVMAVRTILSNADPPVHRLYIKWQQFHIHALLKVKHKIAPGSDILKKQITEIPIW